MKSLITCISEKLLLNKNKKAKEKIIPSTREELDRLIKISITNHKDLNDILDLNHIDVSKITQFDKLFKDTRLQKLDISSWETSQVTTFESMFEGNIYLTEVDLSNFNTSSLISMKKMFKDCIVLENIGDLQYWNIKNLKDASWAFYSCENLKLDLSDLHLISNGVKTFNINKYTNIKI